MTRAKAVGGMLHRTDLILITHHLACKVSTTFGYLKWGRKSSVLDQYAQVFLATFIERAPRKSGQRGKTSSTGVLNLTWSSCRRILCGSLMAP